MKDLLKEISQKAILLNDFEFTADQITTCWLGFQGASESEIEAAEKRLNVNLPEDYKSFLRLTNGFAQTSITGFTFLPADKIDYLRILNEDLVDIECEQGGEKDATVLKSAILIAGYQEEQQFLLVPPNNPRGKWAYYSFAFWYPGLHKHHSLIKIFESDLTFLKSQTKGLKKPVKNKVDYRLRNAVFNLDWDDVFYISKEYIEKGKAFPYFNVHDVFAIWLIAASKTNRLKEFSSTLQRFIIEYNKSGNIYFASTHLTHMYIEAANNNLSFVSDFQLLKFTVQENKDVLKQIEKQIEEHRKDLLKEKNRLAKVDYQLYFLFNFGALDEFIQLYELHKEAVSIAAHLRAVILFSAINQSDRLAEALDYYLKSAMDYRPLDPFLSEQVLNKLNKNILSKVTSISFSN